mmetsp:Transcript_925/g.1689  ORF Transcript_925/g.1689 Transcript_925/m.1689 type:complete len:248 (-) Transcript_925:48-791(-)
MRKSEYFKTLQGNVLQKILSFLPNPSRGEPNSESENAPSEAIEKKAGMETVEIVCYGIGKVGSSPIAQYQLALLLLLVDSISSSLSAKGAKIETGTIVIRFYDPVLSKMETDVLTSLGLVVIPTNEQCKRKVERPTLFYMPHCARAMYNNVVWANWGSSLASVAILGNSFSTYGDKSNLEKKENRIQMESILKIIPYVEEIRVADNFTVSGIFNDFSLHLFKIPAEKGLGAAPPELKPDNVGELIVS